MSLTDMLAQLDSLTRAERIVLAEAALEGVDEKLRPRPVNGAAILPPRMSKEEFLREWRKLPPMDEETYQAYKEGIAWSSQIDEDAWK